MCNFGREESSQNELEKQGKWDWDALVDTARKLTRTDATGKKFWGFLRPSGLTLTVMYMWQNGGTPFSDDRTQCLVNSPECVAAEQWIADLVLKQQVATPVVDPTGRQGWFLTTKAPLRDTRGRIVGLVGVGRDITELKREEEQHRLTEARLQAILDNTRQNAALDRIRHESKPTPPIDLSDL